MLFHAMLREEALTQLKTIGRADIVIGLPTDKTQPRLAVQVAQQVIEGLQTYYSDQQAIIINTDTGSKKDTRLALQALETDQVKIVSGRYEGAKGKGAAMCAILDAALHLEAKAIIFLDSHTESVIPTWVPALATPILNNQADLVKPRYHWPLPNGAFSDLLFYPFIRAVWGLNIRHPAAGDFALSPNLALAVLDQDVWYTEVNKFGADVWLSTFVCTENWRPAQSALGEKNERRQKPSKRAPKGFVESVGTMMRQVSLRQQKWHDPDIHIPTVPTLTKFAPQPPSEVVPQKDSADFIEALALGWIDYRPLWQHTMQPEHLSEVERLVGLPDHLFYFPSDLWAKIVYDFTVVYNKGDGDPDATAASIYPLYLGRLASYWPEVAGLTTIGREGTVSAQAVEFEENLPYLKERWENYYP